MKVGIIGGGPAGLYFAILTKKAWPQTQIDVFERNRPDDTFGFGVVFSDETLDDVRGLRPRELSRDHRAISPTGTTSKFISRARRTASAATASAAARARPAQAAACAGARARRRAASSSPRSIDIAAAARDADLVVGADGINSRVRETFADHFKPEVDLRPNKFAWMGSTRPFDAFTFFFRETPARHLHRPLLSIRAGPLDLGDGDRSANLRARRARQARRGGIGRNFCEDVFAEELQGHKLIINRSHLAQFPDHPLRALDRGQCRPSRRRQGDRAFLHRFGHQARDGRRDRALRGVSRQPAGAT